MSAILSAVLKASNQTGPVYSGLQAWPQIYLCMRCGKRDEAADIALGASEALENRNSRGQGTVKDTGLFFSSSLPDISSLTWTCHNEDM